MRPLNTINSDATDIDALGNAVEQTLRQGSESPAGEYAGANNPIESEGSCWLQIALPGVAPGSLHVDAAGRKISVHGNYHVPEVQGATYVRRQLREGSFEAAFGLPAEVDMARAEAQYDRGILTVWLPQDPTSAPPADRGPYHQLASTLTGGGAGPGYEACCPSSPTWSCEKAENRART